MEKLSIISSYINSFNLEDLLGGSILPFIDLKKFKKDDIILSEGGEVKNIYFLVDGVVEISSITLSGHKLFITDLHPLELFGDIEYVQGTIPMFDVVATKETTCLILPFDKADLFLDDNAKFWKVLAFQCNKKLLRTNTMSLDRNIYPLKFILCHYIIGKNYEITFNSLSELSTKLNVSYRNLSRVIKGLSDEKIIYKERKKIIGLDRRKLLNIVNTYANSETFES